MARPKLVLRRKQARRSENHRQQRELNNSNTRLLKLPAELRNRIFALAVPSDQVFTSSVDDHAIEIDDEEQSCTSVHGKSYSTQLAITQTSRQIRAETLQVAYASNTFVLDVDKPAGSNEPERWIESRPSTALDSMAKVVLHSRNIRGYLFCPKEVTVTINLASDTTSSKWSYCAWCYSQMQELIEEYVGTVEELTGTSKSPRDKLLELPGCFER